MKKYLQKVSVLVVSLSLIASVAKAQNSSNDSYLKRSVYSNNYNSWSGGITLGNVALDGDLRSFGEDETYLEFGAEVFVTKQINSIFGVQGEIIYGELGGQNVAIARKTTDGDFFNVTVNGLLYLTNIGVSNKEDKKFNVYLKLGIGVVRFDAVTTNLNNENFDIREQPSTTEIEIPVGLGVRYKLNNKFDLEVASTMHSVFGDGLDGTGGSGGGVAAETEKFFYTSVGFVYKFGDEEESLAWANPFDYIYDGVYDLKNEVDEVEETQDDVATEEDLNSLKGYIDTEAKKLKEQIAKNKKAANNNSNDSNSVSTVEMDYTTLESFLPSVFFEVDDSELNSDAKKKLAVIAKLMESDDVSIVIVGFADETGPADYNKALAKRRSKAVKDYLVDIFGISPDRLDAKSKGETSPLADGNKKINRRVDFHIK